VAMWQIKEIDYAVEASIGYKKTILNFLSQTGAKTNSNYQNLLRLMINPRRRE